MINFQTFLLASLVLFLTLELSSPAFAEGNGMAEKPEVAAYTDPTIAAAVEVSPNEGWFEFSFIDTNNDVRGCLPSDPVGFFGCMNSTGTPTQFASSPPWTFECPSRGCWLTVTDAFLYGDVFEVFDNSKSIGTTPNAAADPENGCGNDPEVCLLDSSSSSKMFSLGDGTHSITMRPKLIVDEGAAYFKIEIPGRPVVGSILQVNSFDLVIAGLTTNAIWMVPIVAGIAGTGIYLTQFRQNRD